MPFAVERIDHVEVFVRDIPAAAHWYAEVLGLREIGRWDPEPIMIGAGGTKLALFRADAAATKSSGRDPESPQCWRRVAWRTTRAGLETAQAHLRSHSIRFDGPYDHGSTFSIYFEDLDGHPLEITCDA